MSGEPGLYETMTIPWTDAQGHFIFLYGEAQDAYNLVPRTSFSGEWIAGENTYDELARDYIDAAVNEMGSDSEHLRTYAEELIGGAYLDSPFLTSAIDALINDAQQVMTEEVLPSILDAAVAAGAYSGTAFETLELSAIEKFSEQASRVSAKVFYENFARERSLQHSAFQIFGAAEGIDAERGKLTQANADMLRGITQLDLDNELKKFFEDIEAPWRGTPEYLAVLTAGNFSSTTQKDFTKSSNPVGSALQGAMGGAIAGATTFGPMGAVAGGFLGAVGGLLS